jgi:hypothetical protein
MGNARMISPVKRLMKINSGGSEKPHGQQLIDGSGQA